ncbi:hypothetical protein EVAR_37084_1 [Eumeta japonica]|uniref:Uncharacterized protein n=1 Tax=Eumeta variegata TaxID=151549 RepID=A0A4C1WF64_EUMVA|nr:hypothetical protein EVAR_37084_1 [Eumeta japonica]
MAAFCRRTPLPLRVLSLQRTEGGADVKMAAFCRRTPLPLRVLSLQRTWKKSRDEDGGVLSPYTVTAPGALTAEDVKEEPTWRRSVAVRRYRSGCSLQRTWKKSRDEDGGVLSPYTVTAPGALTAEDVKEEPT